MRRFRLLSLIVAMLTASALLWGNTQGRWVDSGQPPYFAYSGTWVRGWPLAASSNKATLFNWKEYKGSRVQLEREFNFESIYLERSSDPKYPYLRPVDHSRGTVLIEKQIEFHWGQMFLNVLLVIAISIAALFACELQRRSRDARANPGVPA